MMFLWLGLVWSISGLAGEPLSLHSAISSNAVLQCERELPVRGRCSPHSPVYIYLDGDLISSGSSDSSGEWELLLPPQDASYKLHELFVISSEDTLVLSAVLFGEVWLASGQSNMEFPVKKATGGDDFLEDEYEYIRVLRVPHRRGLMTESVYEQDELKWEGIMPETSAVAAFFAAELQRKLHRPVGIIQSTWGGTNCETWTPLSSLGEDSRISYKADELLQAMSGKEAEEYEQEVKTYDAWVYEQSRRKKAGEPSQDSPKPKLSVYNPQSKNAPSSLYQNMIVPLQPLAIRGVLWYQGESNAFNHQEYFPLFQALVRGWRKDFQQDLPFLFVQLPAYGKNFRDMRLVQSALRDSITDAEMVCALDCGDELDGHPKDKKEIGDRLALLSLKYVYGWDILARGPLPQQIISIRKEGLIVQYDYVGNGLIATGETIPGFEVSDRKGEFQLVKAVLISENEILIDRKIRNPQRIRYAYVNWPDPPLSLKNSAGLPAEPFDMPVTQY